MDSYYLGYVEYIDAGLWGRIRPLTVLRKRAADDTWIVDRVCASDELGATGLVFWPRIPRDQDHLLHQYVRFKVEPNQKVRDSEVEKDEFVVAEDRRNSHTRRVATLGRAILPEDRVSGVERIVDSSTSVKPDVIVFRRRKRDTLIDGPWRVAKVAGSSDLCLQPKEDGHVLEYSLPRLSSETFHIWNDEQGERQAVLLVDPPKLDGQVIDLLPNSGLAEWLIRILRRDTTFLASLDRSAAGWRGRIGELLNITTEPVQRELDQRRFSRLEAALDALAADEARLSDLVELPRFKEVLSVAIGLEVESARDRIEAAAMEETRSLVGRKRQEREQAQAEAEREMRALRCELDKARSELADAERLSAEARAKAERDESSIRAAADYLLESRERIIRDFSAFHGLIEHTRVNGNGLVNGHQPGATKFLEVPSPSGTGVVPDGPAINDPHIFLGDRLAPAMASWGAEATRLQAKRLHAALISCRWIAAPCSSWGVAYSEAMGASARYRIVTVEPTWLSFSDAWNGEIRTFWQEALEQQDALHLLIFADADRALVQCWARPLLDIVSGVRPTLPSGHSWPENLRVMACPSADEAALHVPDWVVAHWAGVAKAGVGATRPDGPIRPGHVPFSAWRSWVLSRENLTLPSTGLGIAARCAARERSGLARTLRHLDPNDDEEKAEMEARAIRESDARIIFAGESRG